MIHDTSRNNDAKAIAEDLSVMRACVVRRLAGAPAVDVVAQWPRGLPPGNGDAADLREGEGSLWISEGLPGAVGLLCVAETDGIEALLSLLSRGAQQTTEALAGAETPVGALSFARRDEWAADYAPLAALHWASGLTPRR